MESVYNTINTREALAHLADWDPRSRHRAREQLVTLGEAALPLLTEKLADPDPHVRWEAAKALGQIGNPLAAQPLVDMLQDDDTGVRWAAMGSLIMLGRACMEPLLLELTQNFQSARLRQGVHHILHSLASKGMLTGMETAVLHALEGLTPTVKAAEAANRALIVEYDHIEQ